MGNRLSTEGTFHIINGIVHSCNGNCNELEHWTTLDHAMASLNKPRITTGEPVTHHAPAAALATRPVPLEKKDSLLSLQLNGAPVYDPGTTAADYEPSVVNRTYEIDSASFDIGDLLMRDLWLGLADHDDHEILAAVKRLMEWSDGLIDGRVHKFVFIKEDTGFEDPNRITFNGKLQRLAADLYCGGWTGLQREIETRWIIPSMTIKNEEDHLVEEMSNPLAYLEATRMAILTMKDAMTGAAIPDLKMMESGSIRQDAGWTWRFMTCWMENLDKENYLPIASYTRDEDQPSSIRKQIVREAADLDLKIQTPNTTPAAQAFGFTEVMSPLEPMMAVWVEGWIRKNGVSESYGAAAWKLARSIWTDPDGPSDLDDTILDCDPIDQPIDTGLLKKAMDWFTWVYQSPQVASWVQQIPVDRLDPWRKVPMTGKIDRLHRVMKTVVDPNGTPVVKIDDGYLSVLKRGLLFKNI